MFFIEIKKKYFNIIFFFIIIIGGAWLYSALKPAMAPSELLGDYGDYYKYNYFKPLNKAEFVYFELVSDYKKGITTICGSPEGTGWWGSHKRILNDTEKGYFLEIIKKINPAYKDSEKMADVHINMSYSDIKPYLYGLEEKLHIYSIYYTGMNDPGYFNGIKQIYDNSPYFKYKSYTKRFHGKKYKEALKDFMLTYKHGISGGYAYAVFDNLAIIMGIIAIIYSFMSYSEEKRTEINGYIYTGNINSVKYVIFKYLADIVPLMVLSIIYSLFGAACFIYWNYKFNYGYNISIIPFLVKTPLIIFPTILIVTAAGHFLGIVFQSGMMSVIIQFILFYLSMHYGLGNKFSLSLLIKYNNFDDYSLYKDYPLNVIPNRIIITLLSIVLTGFSVMLFNYRREYGSIIIVKNIKKFFTSLWQKACKIPPYKKKPAVKKQEMPKSLVYYICKQSVNKALLLYIPYLCLALPAAISKNMDSTDIAIAGENIIIFASMFLFIRLGNMEEANGMGSHVFTTKCFYPFFYILRVEVAAIILFIIVEVPVLLLCILNGAAAGKWCIGVYLSSLFIGMSALLVTEVTGSYFLGYFSYIIYYLFDTVLIGGMPLSVAGYTHNIQDSKIYIGMAVIVITVLLLIITYNKSKGIVLIKKRQNRKG